MDGEMKVWPIFFFSRAHWMAAMAGSSGDSITRRSVASQFFTQEEGLGIDVMTTSERVSRERRAWSGGRHSPCLGNAAPGGRAQGVLRGLGWQGWHHNLPLPLPCRWLIS